MGDLGGYSTSQVVYHSERNWRNLSQSIVDKTVSVVYEQDLSNTKWSTSTESITFRYALGTSAQGTKLGQHASTSYSKVWTFDLKNGVISSSGSDTLKIVHGIIMTVAWALLVTIGIFSSRFRVFLFQKSQNKAMWFFMHRGIQICAVIFVLIAFGLAVYFIQDDGSAHFSNLHECMGLTVVILAVLQPINAWFRPHAPKKGQTKSIGRFVWEIIHKLFGYVTWILAQIAIYLGIKHLTTKTIYLQALLVYELVIVGTFILLSMYNAFCFKPAPPIPAAGQKRLIQNNESMPFYQASPASTRSMRGSFKSPVIDIDKSDS